MCVPGALVRLCLVETASRAQSPPCMAAWAQGRLIQSNAAVHRAADPSTAHTACCLLVPVFLSKSVPAAQEDMLSLL